MGEAHQTVWSTINVKLTLSKANSCVGGVHCK